MIEDYLNQTLELERRTGTNLQGEGTFAAAVDLPARIQYRQQQITNAQGELVTSTAVVDLAPGAQIAPGDRATDPDVNRTAYVLAVERKRALDSESHVMAFLGA